MSLFDPNLPDVNYQRLLDSILAENNRLQEDRELVETGEIEEEELFGKQFLKRVALSAFAVFLAVIIAITFACNWLFIGWQGTGSMVLPTMGLSLNHGVHFDFHWHHSTWHSLDKEVITTYTTVSLAQGVILIQQLASICGNETFLDKIGNILEKLTKKVAK